MFKKIPIDQVQLGMFIQSLDGPWLAHPFWRSKFLLTDPADLQALKSSDVPSITIDESKSTVRSSIVADQPVPGPLPNIVIAEPEAKLAPAMAPAPARRKVAIRRCTLAEELDRATDIVRRSKQEIVRLFKQARLGKVRDVEVILPLVDEIAVSVARSRSALISIARLKSQDEYTYMHSIAVCALMVNLARELQMDDAAVKVAGIAGMLHDVGKMLVPAEMLNKAGELSAQEFDIVRAHTRRGFTLLNEDGEIPSEVLDVCLHHHERVDGSGYPDGLVGDQIGILARMCAICDVYDAITSHRPYKEAGGPTQALSSMFRSKGHFDPAILNTFIRSVGIYPVGSLVRLKSGRLGVVADENARDLTKPIVRIVTSVAGRPKLSEIDIDMASSDEQIIAKEDPLKWGFTSWDAPARAFLQPM